MRKRQRWGSPSHGCPWERLEESLGTVEVDEDAAECGGSEAEAWIEAVRLSAWFGWWAARTMLLLTGQLRSGVEGQRRQDRAVPHEAPLGRESAARVPR